MSFLFTAIVPVAKMSGELDLLYSWLKSFNSNLIEIIVVHDKHDEKTGVELRELIQKLPLQKIVFIEGYFGSPGAARNAGLDQVNSNWIAFWDSDDLPNVEEFSKMVQNANASNHEIAIGGYETCEYDQEATSRHTFSLPTKCEWGSNIPLNPGLWRWAFRRQIVGSKRFQNFLMGEDQCFLVSLEPWSKKIYLHDESVYLYKLKRSGQLTGSKIAINEILKSIQYLQNLFKKRKTPPDYFELIILLRQILTAIKLGSFKTKVISLHTFSLFFLNSLFFNFSAFAKSIKTIYLLSLRHKSIPTKNIVLSIGGLGNQLFQLTAGLCLTGSKNLILDYSAHKDGREGSRELSEYILPSRLLIDSSLKLSFFQKKIINLCIRMSSIEPASIVLGKLRRWFISSLQKALGWIYPGNWRVNSGIGFDMTNDIDVSNYLLGYFQTFRYFEHPEINRTMRNLSLRNPSEAFIRNRNKLANLDSLIVHVRLGDYKNESNFGIPNKKYFHDSILSLWDGNVFSRISLFSNEIDEAVAFIPTHLRDYLWIPSDDLTSTAETLELMRYGRAYVLSNSSFGWWAATLSFVDSPSVICPSPWFQKKRDPLDLIPKDWICKSPIDLEK